MKRLKELTTYQKLVLVLLFVLLVVFTVAYSVISARVGYAYKGVILLPHEEEGSIVYTGRVKGEAVSISSTWDNLVTVQTVTVRHGQKTYGPYTARKAPDAVPEGEGMSPYMTGVELRLGDSILFRGGVLHTDDSQMILLNEDGSLYNAVGFTYSAGDGIQRDEDGNPVDQKAPSVWNIVEVMKGPKLTSKGNWLIWFLGVFLSAVTAVLVLFPDELFRWKLSFRINNAYEAEPSDWELTVRHASWLVLVIIVLLTYIVGLTV